MHDIAIVVIIILMTYLFHNVTCYTNALLSHIHVHTTYLINIMYVILGTQRVLLTQIESTILTTLEFLTRLGVNVT